MARPTPSAAYFHWEPARARELAARLGLDLAADSEISPRRCALHFAATCIRRSPAEVVRAGYEVFLCREPDGRGLLTYTDCVRRGEMSPADFARALMSSREFDVHMAPGGAGRVVQTLEPNARSLAYRLGLRVAVVGNCQSEGIAHCLQAMVPGLDARGYFIRTLLGKPRLLRAAMRDRDLVLAHKEPGAFVALEHAPPACEVVFIPRVCFAAFHPDVMTVSSRSGMVNTPMIRSSRIAFLAHRLGLDVDATVRLFRADVYRALGYLDVWGPARAALAAECAAVGFPVDALFRDLPRGWCFMHSPFHPKFAVLAAATRTVLRAFGWPVRCTYPENHLPDPLSKIAHWPVYPEIAAGLDVPGSLDFKLPGNKGVSNLAEFVAGSFAAYDRYGRNALTGQDLPEAGFEERFRQWAAGPMPAPARIAAPTPGPVPGGRGPYDDLPAHRFWKQAVADVPPADVDPVAGCRFTIDRSDCVASAGSCFAQHISRELAAHGFNYFVAEQPPSGTPDESARRAGYAVFSARYGNIYTARQLVQLFDRAHDRFRPAEPAWRRPDGRFVDPFRPRVEPDGFADPDEVEAARVAHLSATREMFRSLDVLVFTLGLTEAWSSAADGAVFPVAPGVVAGAYDPARYEFANFSVAEVVADLGAFIERLADVNPVARVILTVSPVPLAATFADRHVVTATGYSKAVLRAAAEEVRTRYANVEYFPSYEIVTGLFGRGSYFDVERRAVTADAVGHVMRVFLRHFAADGAASPGLAASLAAGFNVVCDDEPPAEAGSARRAA